MHLSTQIPRHPFTLFDWEEIRTGHLSSAPTGTCLKLSIKIEFTDEYRKAKSLDESEMLFVFRTDVSAINKENHSNITKL